MSVFIDTSALVALLDAEDPRGADAARTFRELLASEELVTHSYVHVEAIAVVDRRLGAQARDILINDVLPAIRTFWVDEHLHRRAIASYQAGGGGASLVDRVSFEFMRDHGIDAAFAYDPDFVAAGFRSPIPLDDGRPGRLSETPGRYDVAGRPSDLVSVTEIAARAGRSINTVQSWRRRRSDFPMPEVVLAAGPVWSWTAIERWIDAPERRRTAPRVPGLLKGKITLAADFDAPILVEPTVPPVESGHSGLATRADDYLKGFGEH
jgi:predicted nucleic acid-binding protein